MRHAEDRRDAVEHEDEIGQFDHDQRQEKRRRAAMALLANEEIPPL